MKKVLKVTFILTGENSGHTGNFGGYDFKDGKYQIVTRDHQALASAINILRHYAAFPSDFVRWDLNAKQYNLAVENPDIINDKLVDEHTGNIQQIPVVAGNSQPDPDDSDGDGSDGPDDELADGNSDDELDDGNSDDELDGDGSDGPDDELADGKKPRNKKKK